ncbi:EAL domain-containing protein [Actinoplanes sp. NPDC051475]|uniref:putative bifunctional diguanylate cyclase/phosphodiesterase n=1 Tax=Actinoplanes sp. NPDC051475 TaxID=3157225 RepID=UPI00344EEADE
MTTRIARACYAAWLASLTGVYYAWPDERWITRTVIGLSGVAAVLAGVRTNRPAQRLPWYLMAGALLLFSTGDTLYNLQRGHGLSITYARAGDVFYVLVYPLLAVALALFIRARAGDGNRAALLDALVPTASLGLLAWVLLVAPYSRAADLSGPDKAFSMAYPLGDVLALAMMLRLLAVPGRKPLSAGILALSVCGMLVADIFYGLLRLGNNWAPGGTVDLGWIAFYFAAGYAALHPSMTRMTNDLPSADCAVGARRRRLLFMTAATLIAPGVLLAEHLSGGIVDAPVIAAGSALMFLLVMARVDDLLTDQRRTNQRERALRRAGASLAAATTEADVIAAMRTAVATLMPPGRSYQLVVTDPVPCDGICDVEDGVTMVATTQLCAVPDPDFEFALHAQMVLPGSPPRRAAVYLAAAAATLRAQRPAFQALFAQIAIVVERINLAGEISRRDGEAYFRTLVRNASDVIMIIDNDDRIRYASPSATTVFGGTDPAGNRLSALIADTHHDALADVLARARAGHGNVDGVYLSAVCANGRPLQVECAIRDLRDDPTVRGLVLTVQDVTERRRLENDLVHQAFHDELTGLANRVLFRNRLDHAFAMAGRDGSEVGVLFVDIDDFKEVNDALGHAVGDQLLVAVGQRIAQTIGAHNTAARMGGDEFAILIEQAPDADAAEAVAAGIIAALAAPVQVLDSLGGTHTVSGAASIGLATSGDAASPSELLRHADLALYLAKGAGKGSWQRYQSDLDHAMVERLALRTALHEAVRAQQFVLQYQPIVDIGTATIVGVEALVRWQHPQRGLLGPCHFIEMAEESGVIVGIGGWVLREALRQFALWRAAAPGTSMHYVSVNVSARQFRMPGFVDQVRAGLADAGARPEWLLLEITESLVLRDAEQVCEDLRTLRALGVRIAIDDFGTGYSSLSYLRRMPVDVLKIDKSFIDDILASKQQRALVSAIVTLAGDLDLTVVAEGVEDAEQRRMLAAMGGPYGQGYLFSKPVWPSEIPPMLDQVAVAA